MISVTKHFTWGSIAVRTTINLPADGPESSIKQLLDRREMLLREAAVLGELADGIKANLIDEDVAK